MVFANDGSLVRTGNEASAEEVGKLFGSHDGRLIHLKQLYMRRILSLCGRPLFRGGFGNIYVSEYLDEKYNSVFSNMHVTVL